MNEGQDDLIDMTATLKFKGKWWLPDNETDKVSGTLYFTPGEAIRLELIGNFENGSKNALEEIMNVHRVDTIWGQIQNGKDVTLFDSGCSINRFFKADYSVAIYSARYIVIGTHLNSLDEKCFFKAVVDIPELSYWKYPDTLIMGIQEDSEGKQVISVSTRVITKEERTKNKVRIGSGYTFTLDPNRSFNGSDLFFEPSFKQFTNLCIEKTGGASFRSFYNKVVEYEGFLSLAMLREVAYKELSLFSLDVKEQVVGKTIYKPIIVDSVVHPAPSEKKIETHKFLFNYKDIEADYKAVIKKWFARDPKFDAIRTHFLDSIDYHGHFSYMNFLVIVQAIEGYSRRYMKEMANTRRLANGNNRTKMRDYLEAVIFNQKDIRRVNQKIDISATIQSRDYYSHLLDEKKKKKLDGVELYNLTSQLRRILTCCILTHLGFSNTDIDKFTSETNNSMFTE